ncbi:MAG: hypothetical protein JW929_12235 [Anaerolineales bacterium]|nr:hypothetical protein [Anaerolineales bacterium]
MYYYNRCAAYIPANVPPFVNYEVLCLNAVRVNGDYSLQFILNWSSSITGLQCYDHVPDVDRHDIFLRDDLDHRYDHIDSGGCAAVKENLCGSNYSGEDFADCSGWLLFPAAKPEATTFNLVDNRNGFIIEGIVLQ